ncbi:phosphinothricin acetyltransferase [Palleronia salina]|uniref:Phosphinothricin acetyltransferase n=1 Tax=Palleronia salina TaxID=313368 RepID=A0A1M6HJJ2_9RHOB|nr:GNAT family N-acetyltransferase [Palleronia salina]SHJ22348.1 phosphinothricin acetyltransferase [Palleronia salina]
MPNTITTRAAQRSDIDAIARIDRSGLSTGRASFRDTPHDARSFAAFDPPAGLALLGLVDGEARGWAGVSRTSPRAVYAGVGEISVYVEAGFRGAGLGARLIADTVAASEPAGFWTLVAQCFAENAASIAALERAGFVRLGLRERLGRMTYGPRAGQWCDVMMMERRSSTVGLD